jgi:hypothetical protein
VVARSCTASSEQKKHWTIAGLGLRLRIFKAKEGYVTDEQLKALQQMRDEGYAIIVWSPEDAESIGVPAEKSRNWMIENRKHIEDHGVELGWTVLEALK